MLNKMLQKRKDRTAICTTLKWVCITFITTCNYTYKVVQKNQTNGSRESKSCQIFYVAAQRHI